MINTIIIGIFTIIFFLPALVLGLISVVIINVVIAYTGTDYFDCWLIERDYCYEEGGEFYIPESPMKLSEDYEALA